MVAVFYIVKPEFRGAVASCGRSLRRERKFELAAGVGYGERESLLLRLLSNITASGVELEMCARPCKYHLGNSWSLELQQRAPAALPRLAPR